jgi:hypothetical protein
MTYNLMEHSTLGIVGIVRVRLIDYHLARAWVEVALQLTIYCTLASIFIGQLIHRASNPYRNTQCSRLTLYLGNDFF